MSDEQRKDEETEVEGHVGRAGANDEAGDENEVEGHVGRAGMNEEGDDFEGHVNRGA
jgi:hypothetical protein